MWTKCGCYLPPIYEEETIPISTTKSFQVVLIKPELDLDELRREVICDTKEVIKKLECGIKTDLELILEKISLIEIQDEVGTEV